MIWLGLYALGAALTFITAVIMDPLPPDAHNTGFNIGISVFWPVTWLAFGASMVVIFICSEKDDDKKNIS